jgi:hypothetical protein
LARTEGVWPLHSTLYSSIFFLKDAQSMQVTRSGVKRCFQSAISDMGLVLGRATDRRKSGLASNFTDKEPASAARLFRFSLPILIYQDWRM